jgi:large subunit ribosomal protein L7/L12
VFNVKLESFDAGAKPKIIREVKAMIPNLTLIDVRRLFVLLRYMAKLLLTGQEVRRVATKSPEGESPEGGC